MASTRRELEALLADDGVPRRKLATAIMSDPALALRVLQRANAVKHRHFSFEVCALEDAAHMLGTERLASIEQEAACVEDVLDARRLSPYLHCSGRALLSAMLARDWAELDRDRFPAEVSLAALLNNLGELYLLAHGDARIGRYLELVDVRHVFPHEAEYVSLGESLEDLGYRLATLWGLPEMVRESMRARNARHLRTLCVMLATQTARYACSGWRHPGQLTDLQLAADMLDLDIATLFDRINSVLTEFNARAAQYGLTPLAHVPTQSSAEGAATLDRPREVVFCLAPRQDELQSSLTALDARVPSDRDAVIKELLHGLHRGLGLNRAVFAVYDVRRQALVAEQMVGTDFEPRFNRFMLPIEEGGLFGELLQAPCELWLNDANGAELAPRIPNSVMELVGVSGFFVKTLWVDGQPLGVVYADRRHAGCALDARAYQGFVQLIATAQRCLEHSAA
jgi:HD-like signal output (HDOD) protein